MVDDQDDGPGNEKAKKYTDFDCPSCDANNPYDEGFVDGDEVRCFYCGELFTAKVSDGGRLKLKPV